MRQEKTSSMAMHEISIDYTSGKVKFKNPRKKRKVIKKDTKINKIFRDLFESIYLICIRFFAYACCILSLILLVMRYWLGIDITLYPWHIVIQFFMLISLSLLVYAIAIFSFYKKTFLYKIIRRDVLNELFIKSIANVDHKFLIIKKGNLKSKTFEIPKFNNYMLDYELYGEYSKFIKSVKTKAIKFKDLKTRKMVIVGWKAIFTFKEIPKHGKMKIIATYDKIKS